MCQQPTWELQLDRLALKNWQEVINRMGKRIKELESVQRSVVTPAALQFYSEAASNFRYFKNAWRNHVSHGRATYDEKEAETVWDHVKAFMRRLAAERS